MIHQDENHTTVRIAYVVHNFNMGGLERCVARLANGLDRDHFEPTIICLQDNGTAAQWLEVDDVDIIELHKKPGNDPGVVRRLASALKTNKIDIVHSHNWGTLVETTLARWFARTPIHVHAERGMELDAMRASSWKQRLRGRATRWAFERTDHLIAVAEAVRQQMLKRCGRLKKPIQVVPNGVDVPAIDPEGPSIEEIRNQLKIPPQAVIVGSVGRLVPVKDFPSAIDAIARIRDEKLDVHLLLVGDGPELENLSRHAAQQHLTDRVHLVGRRNDVGNWLAAMDIYLNCSLNEGMSQSILEAMAAGVPPVVTDVGDNAALIGDVNTQDCIVRSGNADQLASALSKLVLDGELRGKLGTQAKRRHVSHYTVEKMISNYETMYNNLLDRGGLLG